MQVVKEHGLRIPEDIALAAFANQGLAALTIPTLTSLDQQGGEMGKAAVHLLLKLLADTDQVIASQSLVLKPKLLVGASSVAATPGREIDCAKLVKQELTRRRRIPLPDAAGRG